MGKWKVAAGAAVLLAVAGISLVRADRPAAEVEARRAQPPSRFVEVDGMRVHYRDRGEGPALLLVHGSNASLFTWEGWASRLSDRFRVVSLDMPGHGLTGPHPQGRYDYAEMAVFLDHFVQAVGLERFHLAGNSMGGSVAWHYALAHPAKVDRLVLVDAVGYEREEPLPPILRLFATPGLNRIAEHVTPRFAVEQSIRDVYGDPSRVTEELVDLYEDLALREGNREASRKRLSHPHHDGLEKRLGEIRAPTLILWGGKDRWILPKYAHRFDEDIPDSQLILYPELGHVPMEEDPETTAAAVRRFLGGRAQRAAGGSTR
ncbi:alpha/beta fold hydrolase [Vulgatibacter sp.]|uniref:alpha/beta fold hydrolase n=1 Tax=Vulgatibacter sp. TaxID=1971226 RepID=UPI00356A50A9